MKPATQPALPLPRRQRLAYHIAVVLVVKLILLALLWHAFIKPNKVQVDIGAMSERIAGPVSRASIPTSPGDNQ
jgi:hypothetical protein